MKLPKQAKKVFSGIIFDTYHWEQELYDGTTTTFEMLKRANTLQIIATQGDKILIAKESQPMKENFYTLFGGRQEEHEQTLECAKRELLEESGMMSNDWQLFKSYEPYTKMEWSVHLYIARDCKKISEQHLDAGEKIDILKVNFDEFIDIVCSEQFWGKEIALDIFRMKEKNTLNEFKRTVFGK